MQRAVSISVTGYQTPAIPYDGYWRMGREERGTVGRRVEGTVYSIIGRTSKALHFAFLRAQSPKALTLTPRPAPLHSQAGPAPLRCAMGSVLWL
jgi:hypothetical protein